MNIQQFPGNYKLFMFLIVLISSSKKMNPKRNSSRLMEYIFTHVSTFSDGQRETTEKKNSED